MKITFGDNTVDFSSNEFIISALFVSGLIPCMLYIFIFWGKLNDKFKKYLQKRYKVKFRAGELYTQGDEVVQEIIIKGKVSGATKTWIKFQYGVFVFFSAFWPLLIFVFCIYYFYEPLAPIFNRYF